MFKENDEVIHPERNMRGTVLEVDRDTVYLEMRNGVEMDFPASKLMLASEYRTDAEKRDDEDKYLTAALMAVSELIIPRVQPLLYNLTNLQASAAGDAIRLLGGSATPWDEMSAYHKMNFLCVTTQTKIEDWVIAYKDCKLTELQRAIVLRMIG